MRWNWKYNKIEHEDDNEIINYIKNLKNKDIEINTEDLLEYSKYLLIELVNNESGIKRITSKNWEYN